MYIKFDEAFKQIGASIKLLRTLQNLSQYDIAQRTGISQRTLIRMENGKTNMHLLYLLLIAEALNISPIEILVEANINWRKIYEEGE